MGRSARPWWVALAVSLLLHLGLLGGFDWHLPQWASPPEPPVIDVQLVAAPKPAVVFEQFQASPGPIALPSPPTTRKPRSRTSQMLSAIASSWPARLASSTAR